MSAVDIGANHDSDQVVELKQRLSNKENQCVTLQSQLLKRDAELADMKKQLDETINKLRRETDRALGLHDQLERQAQDMQNEKIQRSNVEIALKHAEDKIKAQERDAKELEITLQRLSSSADGSRADFARLQVEKTKLESRIRELQANLDQLTSAPAPSPSRRSRSSRPRSSSLSNIQLSSLEQQLADGRAALARKDDELRAVQEKLSRLERELTRVQNEKMAMEKAMQTREAALEGAIEDKNEELEYLRAQAGHEAQAREQELLERIEEEEIKSAALEKMVRQMEDESKRRARVDTGKLEERLKNMQARLAAQTEKVEYMEARHSELLRDRETATDQLRAVEAELKRSRVVMQEHTATIESLTKRLSEAQAAIPRQGSASRRDLDGDVTMQGTGFADGLLAPDLAGNPYHSTPVPSFRQSFIDTTRPSTSTAGQADAVSEVQRLTITASRLRSERDALRTDLEFVEMEAKFRVQTLESQLAELTKLMETSAAKDNRRLEVAVSVLSLVAARSQSDDLRAAQSDDELLTQIDAVRQELADVNELAEQRLEMLMEMEASLEAAEARVETLSEELLGTQVQRDGFQVQIRLLQNKASETSDELSRLSLALAQSEDQLAETIKALELVESQRDDLITQVANLQHELETAREELAEAEDRYSQQLTSGPVSAHEATRTLRDYIEELEARVQRRTDQIGAHQHDIRRLETNLRLQEERIEEMTAELDMMSAQKEAMIEDCAEARAARDEALSRVEDVEMEMENLEGRIEALEAEKQSYAAAREETAAQMTEAIQEAEKANVQLRTMEHEREAEVSVLIDVLAETVTRSRLAVLSLRKELAVVQRDQQLSTAELSSAQKRNDQLAAELDNSKSMHSEATHSLEATTSALQTLAKQTNIERRQLVLAVAVLEQHNTTLRRFRPSASSADATPMSSSSISNLPFSGHSTWGRLQEEVEDLRCKCEAFETAEAKWAAHSCRSLTPGTRDSDDAGRNPKLEQSRADLGIQVSTLSDELSAALADLEAAKRKDEHREKDSEDLQFAKTALEAQLSGAERRLRELEVEHADVLKNIRDQLQHSMDELEATKVARHELDCLVTELKEELSRATQGYDQRLRDAERQADMVLSLENELQQARDRHGEEFRELQGRFDQATEELNRIREDNARRVKEAESLAKDLFASTERYEQSEAAQAVLRGEVSTLQKGLAATEAMLQATLKEKDDLLAEIAAIDCKMKQSTTVHETLEGKLRNSNVEISSLREQLDHLAADLSQARSTADHLQSQLSSEVAGRDQAIASLQEEVSMLRRSSVMSTISQEVQDKIDDLEEMLRQKVKEVEENDEAWIIEQKEKKKLARQVETLTRKVHNLEKKLLAAREAAENRNAVPLSSLKPIVAQAHDLPSESAHMAEVRTTSAPIPPPVSATAGVSASPTGSSQTHPDLSTVPFVQAPEHLSGMTAPMTSESTIGKKRRAPDDFDDCDTLPPQAFTVECAPRPGVTKSHTPRSRKLTAARAGFTPVRSTRTETVMMQQSPRRVTTASATTSAYSDPAQEGRIRATSLHRPHSRNLTEADYRHPVSDVTNSPRTVPATMGASATAAAKTAKKGWLNKMRTPALPSEARSTVSSRPMVFKKYNELRRTPV